MKEKELKAIRGKLPTMRDICTWQEDKILQLLRFADFFMQDGKYTITNSSLMDAYIRSEEESFWPEFLARVDKENAAAFRFRFFSMIRTLLQYLKKNQSAITPEQRQVMENNPKLKWALSLFVERSAELGTVVEMDKSVALGDAPGGTVMKEMSPEVLFNTALLKMTRIYDKLMDGITESDLKKMSPTARLELANKFAMTLSKSFATYKPNAVVFQNINVGKAGRQELEESLLAYSQSQVRE